MHHSNKGKIPVQLVFVQEMTPPKNHVVDWGYISHFKQEKKEKYVIRENTTIIDYDYRMGDRVIIRNKTAYKYKNPFKHLYENVQMRTNGTTTLQKGVVTTRINILCINPYNNLNIV